MNELEEQMWALMRDHYGLEGESLTWAVGSSLAVVDALEAIRDGKPWRGITAPAEIARQALDPHPL